MITRKGRTYDGEELAIVEVYAPGENKELVKRENKKRSHERSLIKPWLRRCTDD